VAGYTNQDEHEVTGLSSGKIYRFAFVAENQYGEGDYSLSIAKQASPLPIKMNYPQVDWT